MEPQNPGLIESLLWDGEYHREAMHVRRMVMSAAELGIQIGNEERISQLLACVVSNLKPGKHKIRLLLEHSGELWGSAEPLPSRQASTEVMLARRRLQEPGPFTRHKTTDRALFDSATRFAARHGLADILFLNRYGELTEAANSNVFVRQDGELLTPRLDAGLLPGTYRASVLAQQTSREEILTLPDLLQAEAIYLCNSVRGWRKVTLREGRAEF